MTQHPRKGKDDLTFLKFFPCLWYSTQFIWVKVNVVLKYKTPGREEPGEESYLQFPFLLRFFGFLSLELLYSDI